MTKLIFYIWLSWNLACLPVAILASYWNLPMFPESCRDPALDDKGNYNTLIRIAGSWGPVGAVFETIVKFYGWQRMIVLSDSKQALCLWAATSIYNRLHGRQGFFIDWITMSATPSESDINGYLERVRATARSEYCNLNQTTSIQKWKLSNLIWKLTLNFTIQK